MLKYPLEVEENDYCHEEYGSNGAYQVPTKFLDMVNKRHFSFAGGRRNIADDISDDAQVELCRAQRYCENGSIPQ